jgi:hypothetical protein
MHPPRGGADDELVALLAEARDLRSGDPDRAAQLADRRRLLEAHLHERAAGEVDAVVLPRPDRHDVPDHGRDAGQDHDRGDDVGGTPLLDELVARILEEPHGRLSRWSRC